MHYESMAEAVKRVLLAGRRSVVVAGTHGKIKAEIAVAKGKKSTRLT